MQRFRPRIETTFVPAGVVGHWSFESTTPSRSESGSQPVASTFEPGGEFVARGKIVPNEILAGCHQSLSCQVRPSRSISAIDADGPQVPAV